MAAEKSYTIMLDNGTNNGSTAVTVENFIEKLVTSGSEYISSVTDTQRVYPWTGYAKIGTGSKSGYFTLAISSSAQVVPTKIVLNAQKYNTDTGKLKINLNGKDTTFGSETTPGSNFTDLEFSDASFKETVQSIKVSTTEKRANVKSITIFYEEVVAAVAAPTVDLESDTYNEIKTVTMTAEEGAEVRYSFNPAANFENGTAGTDYIVGTSVTIDKTCTLTAVAVKDGTVSPSIVRNYVMKTAAPEITMGDDKVVSITTGYKDGVTVYYTTDGTPATTESAVYNAPFSILRGSIVNAVAKYKEFDLSDAATFNYSQEQSVTFGMEDYGVNNNTEIKDTPFTKGDVTIVYGGGGSSVTKYYTEAIRLYNSNNITVSSKNGIIASVTFSGVPSGYEFGKVGVTAGKFSDNVWSNINAKTATLTNKKTSQVRFTTITVNYILPEAAESITGINEAGTYYTVNFELNGQVANDGVLYARTTDTSVEASKPDKDYFDKSYEDYDWETKYDQRDWVAIDGNTELEGKKIETGFVASYDGEKLTPVTTIAYDNAASYTLNTFGVANVFYGNYENTENVMGGYKPFFVKAKVNEVAYYVGEVKEAVDGGYELWGSGVCGKLNEKGLKIEANGIEITASAKYQQIEGVLVADAEANGGVKIVALSAPTIPTGVAALKADGKATVYGTEGAVVVNGADGKVMIFDAMGRMVKNVSAEGAATVAMPAGYYIVRTAGTAAKVMVK